MVWNPDQFDAFSNESLRLIAALAAGALNNALLIEQLEKQNILPNKPILFKPSGETEIIGLSLRMQQLKRKLILLPGLN